MGRIISISCKNNACNYQSILYEGAGMIGCCKNEELRIAILDGKIKNDEALRCLRNNGTVESRGLYLCPDCRKFINDKIQYCMYNITISPYGTKRYNVSFPFGKPTCEICGAELFYIKNICSYKVKCPKCGSDLKTRVIGYND